MGRDNRECTNIYYEQPGLTNATSSIPLVDNVQSDQYKALFEILPQGVLYYDSSGRVLVANLAARRILGLTLDQLCDRAFFLRDKDGLPLCEDGWPIQRVLAGETLKDATAIDIIIRRPDDQERQINVSGAPVHTSHGKICGAVITFQDVTEHRNSESRTQRSLDTMLAMAEALVQHDEKQEASVLVEDERAVSGTPLASERSEENLSERNLLELPCRLLHCQRAAIVLLDPQTEVLSSVVSVGYEQHWSNSLHGARLSSLLGSSELVDRLRAGEMLSLDASLQLFRDLPSYKLIAPILKNGELLGILLLGYGSANPDLTSQELAIIHAVANLTLLLIERERALHDRNQALRAHEIANAELERASKINGNFLGIVSHEFRTALTGIQGFSEIMRDRELSIAEMKEFAVDIHTDARRLMRMMTEMLDMDSMKVSHSQLNLSWLDLNAIVIDVVAHMRQANSGHVIRLHLANALPVLRGDYGKLTSVVANLLQNAILHSPHGSEIAVSSQIEGNVVHICIRDYGSGLAAVELERIFERHTRVDASSSLYIETSQPELFIVRETVQMHGGQVWAESVPGKGSIFHFTVRFTDPY